MGSALDAVGVVPLSMSSALSPPLTILHFRSQQVVLRSWNLAEVSFDERVELGAGGVVGTFGGATASLEHALTTTNLNNTNEGGAGQVARGEHTHRWSG